MRGKTDNEYNEEPLTPYQQGRGPLKVEDLPNVLCFLGREHNPDVIA